ncbi:hypothetical protein [Methylogaea oryzae]|uniref:hypothetical protein n=1 Tax=Methylogaea oryzae TaxID=1295382 RepID=UPI0020D11325|nr:hypothetical protein [Methylogaea oryzae]
MIGLLGGCSTHPKNTATLDSKISAVVADDFGQFMYHETLSEENLAETRKIRQWWADDHYWNIDTEQAAVAAADRALKHRQAAEKHLEGWHDAAFATRTCASRASWSPSRISTRAAQRRVALMKKPSTTCWTCPVSTTL